MVDVYTNILNYDSKNICYNFECFKKVIQLERVKIIDSQKTATVCHNILCGCEINMNGSYIYRNSILCNDFIDSEIIQLDFNISKGVYFIFYSFLFPEIKVFDIFYCLEENSIKCKYSKSSFLLLTNYFWISKKKKITKYSMCKEWEIFQNILNIIINNIININVESVYIFRDFILKINSQWGHIKIKVSFCGYCQEDCKIGSSCKSGKHILYCFDCEKIYKKYYRIEHCLFWCK
jgi:hypothetical protein